MNRCCPVCLTIPTNTNDWSYICCDSTNNMGIVVKACGNCVELSNNTNKCKTVNISNLINRFNRYQSENDELIYKNNLKIEKMKVELQELSYDINYYKGCLKENQLFREKELTTKTILNEAYNDISKNTKLIKRHERIIKLLEVEFKRINEDINKLIKETDALKST